MKLAKGNHRLPRRLRLVGIALALSGATFGAHGAGLGRLNVQSSIGQPLRAEIELTSVSPDEAASLTARLASADTFRQASIDYGSALTGLRFSIQRRAGGQPYVLVTSTQLLNEPFLDVLVELSWSSGRLVREYTLLIDPPNAGTPSRATEPGPTIVQSDTPLPVARTRAPRAPVVASGDGGGSTSASSRAPVAPVATSGGGTGGDYVVKSGDTAISIAREYKPDSVTLEQMLAALYRDNSGAFNGNINRLNAGATMKIPDAAGAQSVQTGEARRIIAQSSNFGSYRDRIARNAALAPTARDAGQQASGRLTSQVEDRAASPTAAQDRLQLSRPDATRAASAGGTRAGLGTASADELAAKDRELVETKTRLALLEKNVADLQKLLELKSQSLADLQKAPSPRAPDVAAPAPSSIAASTPVVVPVPVVPQTATTINAGPATTPTSAPTVQAAPVPAPVAAAPTPAPTPAPVVAKTTPAKPIAPPPEPSWYDGLMENSLLLAGLIAVVLLLIGYGLFTARRRRKLAGFEDSIFVDNSVLHANSVFGTTGGQSVDTANSGFHSNFVPVAGNLPEQNEVDPVAEADVYIAYGRDAQAEEILKEALRADPTRPSVRLKLLEIYAKRGDAKMFETTASELYASTGGQGPDWAQAAALGLTIDPHNPLYGETAPVAAPAATATATMTSSPMTSSPMTSSTIGKPVASNFSGRPSSIDAGLGATGLGLSDFGVDPEPARSSATATDYLQTDPLPRPAPNAATSAPSMDLDFDLGFANTGLGPLSTDAPAPAPAAPAPDKNNGLDFDVGASTKPLIDPFTASAFGTGDASARTAVNLPAFRARAENDKTARPEGDGFSASDIFGSSIVADNDPDALYGETPDAAKPASTPTPAQARTQDFRNVVDNHQFDKTEPLDAFSKINLDLDDGYQATALTTDVATRTDVWQAMATKLDLALAYSDIGDKDGARELLEEVVRNGDAAQAGRARALITELG